VERAGGAITSGEYGRVEVDGEGRVTVKTGSLPSGQGHVTVWSELVASQLGVDPLEVRVIAGDTELVPRGVGTMASRSAQLGGSAVWRSAGEVKRRLSRLASDLLEAAEADLVFRYGRIAVAGSPDSSLSFAEVAAHAAGQGVELAAEDWFAPGAQTFPYGVHVAVVEVVLETGEVRLLRMVTVDDCGNVLNPMIVEGQVQGSVVQGIGQALYEGIVYSDDGQPLTSTLVDYQLPRAGDVPPLVSGRIYSPAPSNPLGAKGTGEAGCIGAPPAIVNAVLDALWPYGVTHLDMPLHPHKVWSALQAATESGGLL
jgi:carbon-monoxide dehydrogenase large subunit